MALQTEVVLLLILATAATSVESAGRHHVKSRCLTCCPFGWVLYNGRCFMYQATSMDWASAETHCLNHSAHLVSIHNENEYQLVKAIVRSHNPQENPTWLGLSSCQKKNTWFWADGAKLTFTKWNPTGLNFINEECCVLMNYEGKKDWISAPCDLRYHFLCATRPV